MHLYHTRHGNKKIHLDVAHDNGYLSHLEVIILVDINGNVVIFKEPLNHSTRFSVSHANGDISFPLLSSMAGSYFSYCLWMCCYHYHVNMIEAQS